MELREFVATALAQGIGGIADAQKAVSRDGEVNPEIWERFHPEAAKLEILQSNGGRWVHLVRFDVAVTVAESEGTKGGVGLMVGPVALGSRGESNAQNLYG